MRKLRLREVKGLACLHNFSVFLLNFTVMLLKGTICKIIYSLENGMWLLLKWKTNGP